MGIAAIDVGAIAQAASTGLLLGGIYALSALGLSLVLGVMRLVNLVHGEVTVLGAYLGLLALSTFGLDPLLALPLVFVVVGLAALPVHRLVLAPLAGRGEEAALLTTFALAVIMQNLYIQWFTGDTRAITRPYSRSTIEVLGLRLPGVYLMGFAISLGCTIAVYALMTRSGFGRRLRAGAEDPMAAGVVGVDVGRVHAQTFALGAGLAAMGGVLLGLAFSFTPTSGTAFLLVGFAIVVVGGLGSVAGTFIGGTMLGVLQSLGALMFGDGYRGFIGLVLFLLVLALRPNGLFGRTAAT